MNIDEKLDRQYANCEEIFVKRMNVVGIILTVLSILAVFGSAVAFGLRTEQRTTTLEVRLPNVEQQLFECKSRIDKIDVINSKLDTILMRIR